MRMMQASQHHMPSLLSSEAGDAGSFHQDKDRLLLCPLGQRKHGSCAGTTQLPTHPSNNMETYKLNMLTAFANRSDLICEYSMIN